MTEPAVQQRQQQPDNVTYLSRSCAASFSPHDGPNPSMSGFGSASVMPTLPRFAGGSQRSNWKSRLSNAWTLVTAPITLFFARRRLSSTASKMQRAQSMEEMPTYFDDQARRFWDGR